MSTSPQAIGVLIADDSELFAGEIQALLSSDPAIRVVGIASNGRSAVELAVEKRPDLVLMDLEMPVMGGLQAIEEIMARCPMPILVMTGAVRSRDDTAALEAIRRGALDVVMKGSLARRADEIQAKVRFLAKVPVVRHMRAHGGPVRHAAPAAARGGLVRLVCIVASTGGPGALATILRALPANLDAAVVIVQHLCPGFTAPLTSWLGAMSPLRVTPARQHAQLEPSTVYVAPDDRHILVEASHRLALWSGPPKDGHRPSGDLLLDSVARSCGGAALGVVLTGMGRDGAEGLLALRRAGGRTLGQDEQSSVVFGMPKAAWELGGAEMLLSPEEIASEAVRLAGRHGGVRGRAAGSRAS